jgi:hypothetical protein
MRVSTTKEHPYLVTLHPETFEEEQLLRNFVDGKERITMGVAETQPEFATISDTNGQNRSPHGE